MTEDTAISVSRDALRAELVSLELRLVDRLTPELNKKASVEAVDAIASRVTALEHESATAGGSRDWLWRSAMALPGVAALGAFFHH